MPFSCVCHLTGIFEGIQEIYFVSYYKFAGRSTCYCLKTSLWNDFKQFKTLCTSVRRPYLERGLRDWEGLFFTAPAPLNWFRARRVTKGQQIWHVETFGSWPSWLQLLFSIEKNMYIEYCGNTVMFLIPCRVPLSKRIKFFLMSFSKIILTKKSWAVDCLG